MKTIQLVQRKIILLLFFLSLMKSQDSVGIYLFCWWLWLIGTRNNNLTHDKYAVTVRYNTRSIACWDEGFYIYTTLYYYSHIGMKHINLGLLLELYIYATLQNRAFFWSSFFFFKSDFHLFRVPLTGLYFTITAVNKSYTRKTFLGNPTQH